MIQVKNLSVFYSSKKQKTKALGPINFTADSNDIYAIIGPSGCGKTTILSIIAGLITPTVGSVSISEKPISLKNNNSRKIGRALKLLPVFGDLVFYFFLSLSLSISISSHLCLQSPSLMNDDSVSRVDTTHQRV